MTHPKCLKIDKNDEIHQNTQKMTKFDILSHIMKNIIKYHQNHTINFRDMQNMTSADYLRQ